MKNVNKVILLLMLCSAHIGFGMMGRIAASLRRVFTTLLESPLAVEHKIKETTEKIKTFADEITRHEGKIARNQAIVNKRNGLLEKYLAEVDKLGDAAKKLVTDIHINKMDKYHKTRGPARAQARLDRLHESIKFNKDLLNWLPHDLLHDLKKMAEIPSKDEVRKAYQKGVTLSQEIDGLISTIKNKYAPFLKQRDLEYLKDRIDHAIRKDPLKMNMYGVSETGNKAGKAVKDILEQRAQERFSPKEWESVLQKLHKKRETMSQQLNGLKQELGALSEKRRATLIALYR